MKIITGAVRYTAPDSGSNNHWVSQFASEQLSVGTFSIPVGGLDDQSPHAEDEVYVIQSGRAVLVTSSGDAPVSPGSVVFVPAGEQHRFTEVTEDLAALVIFAPPYSGDLLLITTRSSRPITPAGLHARSRRPRAAHLNERWQWSRCRAGPVRRRARYRDRQRAPSPISR
jgi:mannose-6-phosphate isomerase-like protein (cupin superfamily)